MMVHRECCKEAYRVTQDLKRKQLERLMKRYIEHYGETARENMEFFFKQSFPDIYGGKE